MKNYEQRKQQILIMKIDFIIANNRNWRKNEISS